MILGFIGLAQLISDVSEISPVPSGPEPPPLPLSFRSLLTAAAGRPQIYSNYAIDGTDENGDTDWSLVWVPTSVSSIFILLAVIFIYLTRTF